MGAVNIVKSAENFARLKRRHQFDDAGQVDWNNPHFHSFRRQASINSPTSAVARHSTVSAALMTELSNAVISGSLPCEMPFYFSSLKLT